MDSASTRISPALNVEAGRKQYIQEIRYGIRPFPTATHIDSRSSVHPLWRDFQTGGL